MRDDLCQQCSIAIHGEDRRQLAGLTRRPMPGGTRMPARCAGCGPTIVDMRGKCVATNCEKKHGQTPTDQ